MDRKLEIAEYKREKAVKYAHDWSYKRNPAYLDFDKYGGDCTNYVSQVILAGADKMNYTPVFGWYYLNSGNRTASWTGVEFLFRFLTTNEGMGPFGQLVDLKDIDIGDIIQLSFDVNAGFGHSCVVVKKGTPQIPESYLIAAHTFNTDNYPFTEYEGIAARFIHIEGIRV